MGKAFILENTPLSDALRNCEQGGNAAECLNCGICSSRCSWFEGQSGPVPRKIVRLAQLGANDLLANSSMLWQCMLCNRCTEECPVGIRMDRVVCKARSLPQAGSLIPEDIKTGVKTRLEVGDVNGLTEEEFVETVEWLSEEFADEMGDPNAVIAYNQKNAKFLYLPNPRELGANVLHLTAMAKLFHHFGQPWTLSSKHTDVTNWGYFVGDDDVARKMAHQVVQDAEALGIDTLVLSECGHGFFVLKTLIEELIGRKPAFRVAAIAQIVLEMTENAIIRFDPDKLPEPAAYHDPCNLGRKSGVYDAPRKLLDLCCKQVIELTPNRRHAICCGGGGGILQDSTSKKLRMVSGKPKADQIRATGVKYLATSCLSCHRQLTELCKHYELEVQVDTVASLASKALVSN